MRGFTAVTAVKLNHESAKNEATLGEALVVGRCSLLYRSDGFEAAIQLAFPVVSFATNWIAAICLCELRYSDDVDQKWSTVCGSSGTFVASNKALA